MSMRLSKTFKYIWTLVCNYFCMFVAFTLSFIKNFGEQKILFKKHHKCFTETPSNQSFMVQLHNKNDTFYSIISFCTENDLHKLHTCPPHQRIMPITQRVACIYVGPPVEPKWASLWPAGRWVKVLITDNTHRPAPHDSLLSEHAIS